MPIRSSVGSKSSEYDFAWLKAPLRSVFVKLFHFTEGVIRRVAAKDSVSRPKLLEHRSRHFGLRESIRDVKERFLLSPVDQESVALCEVKG